MDMTVPPQVQHQLDQAQALHSDIYGTKAPGETPPADSSDAPIAPVVDAPETPVTPTPVAPQPSEETFQRKYDVLDGKYRAEVPRLQAQLRERDALLQQMSDRLAALEKKPDDTRKPPALVTEKDVEDFGTDLVEMTRRAAREVFSTESQSLLAALDTRFAALQQTLGSVQARVVETATLSFWDKVSSLVPDWQAVDADPAWVEFLDTRVPGTRTTRRQLAADAIEAGEAEPIKELVDLWRGAKAPVAPAEDPAKKQRQAELQRQVTPSTAKSSVPPQTPKVWTAKEYEFLFSQKAAQTIKPEDLAAQQADAQQAVLEGRIRW